MKSALTKALRRGVVRLTLFTWDFGTSMVPVNGRANVLNAFAVCGPFRELAGTIYREINWLVTDHLGTPRMVVDRNGSTASVKRHDYSPFGEELYAGVGGRSTGFGYTATDGVRQHFTGYERDAESGLDYAQARYYANQQGRFTSVDPLGASADVGDPQSFNRYTYVLNDPVNLTDPDGMMPASVGWAGVADGFWGSSFDFSSPPRQNHIATAMARRDSIMATGYDPAFDVYWRIRASTCLACQMSRRIELHDRSNWTYSTR